MNETRDYRRLISATAAAAACLAAAPAQAQVFGSLANFDAVNDTGEVAHGFEIQIQDPSYDHTKLQSIFGLDRNFGVPPTSVERYGAPSITDLPGIGVTVRYSASFNAGAWSVGTPTGPYPFAGDSCWPLGNAQYPGALTCDHFGVGTYSAPAKVTYNWLVDPGNTGVLAAREAALPAVNFVPQQVPPGDPRPVVAEIEAHKGANEVFGSAYWVKAYSKHLDHRVELENLMKKNVDVPGDLDAVEFEFQVFQEGDVSHGNPNGKKGLNLALAPGDAALVLRYEFFKYQGALKAFGEADCGGHGVRATPADCGGLGDYVGAQMAGFNGDQPLAAVPEPSAGAMLLAGVGAVGLFARRRASARRDER